MAYRSSSLRGISVCMEPSSRGSIIMCVTGGLKGAPAHVVSTEIKDLNVLILPGLKLCHAVGGGLWRLVLPPVTKCCVTGVGSDCDQRSSSISDTTACFSKRLFDAI